MKKILLLFVMALALFACSDSYLETVNKNSLDMGSFFKSENDLLLATNAAYCPLAEGIGDGLNKRGMFGGAYLLRLNILDPYMWFESPNAGLDQLIITSTDTEPFWGSLYAGL